MAQWFITSIKESNSIGADNIQQWCQFLTTYLIFSPVVKIPAFVFSLQAVLWETRLLRPIPNIILPWLPPCLFVFLSLAVWFQFYFSSSCFPCPTRSRWWLQRSAQEQATAIQGAKLVPFILLVTICSIWSQREPSQEIDRVHRGGILSPRTLRNFPRDTPGSRKQQSA